MIRPMPYDYFRNTFYEIKIDCSEPGFSKVKQNWQVLLLLHQGQNNMAQTNFICSFSENFWNY